VKVELIGDTLMARLFSSSVSLLVFLFFIVTCLTPCHSQDNRSFIKEAPEIAYVHGGAGLGLSVFSSDDIRSMTGDFKIDVWDFASSWNLVSGFRNILQFELRWGHSGHKFWTSDIGYSLSSGMTYKETDINMDFNFDDKVLKFNPIFWVPGLDSSLAFFVLWGKSRVEYLDETRDGFKGDGDILGFEVAKISRCISYSGCVKYTTIKFDRGNFFHIPVQFNRVFEASHVEIVFNIQFGFGY
jgi:hypothetical protein